MLLECVLKKKRFLLKNAKNPPPPPPLIYISIHTIVLYFYSYFLYIHKYNINFVFSSALNARETRLLPTIRVKRQVYFYSRMKGMKGHEGKIKKEMN